MKLPAKVKPGGTLRNNKTWDSPHTYLDPLDEKVAVNDPFKYYILFKPDTPHAIWVPVAKAEWFWSATAEKSAKGWRLTDAGGKVTSKGAPTTDFPSYKAT